MATLLIGFARYHQEMTRFFDGHHESKVKFTLLPEWLELLLILKKKPIPQMRVLLIGLVSMLKNHSYYLQKDKKAFTELMTLLADLLDGQKKDEAEKLKSELEHEVDCGFIEEELDDDDD